MLTVTSSSLLLFLFLSVAAADQQSEPEWAPLQEDNTAIADVPGRDDANPYSWWDSYSVGDRCYCKSTFDHNIGDVPVETVLGTLTVRQVCNLLEEAGLPNVEGRPRYNDIQCGNGPANDAGDETTCPGRVEYGALGCAYIGPTWKLDEFVGGANGNSGAPSNQPTPPLGPLPSFQPSKFPENQRQTNPPVEYPAEIVLDPPSLNPSLIEVTNTAVPSTVIPMTDSPTSSATTASQVPRSEFPTSKNTNNSIVPTVLNATWSRRPTELAENNASVSPSVAQSSAPTALINETVTNDAPASFPSPDPTTGNALGRASSAARGFSSTILVVMVRMTMMITSLLGC